MTTSMRVLKLRRRPSSTERPELEALLQVGLALSCIRANQSLSTQVGKNEDGTNHMVTSQVYHLLLQTCSIYNEGCELLARLFPKGSDSIRSRLSTAIAIEVFDHRHVRKGKSEFKHPSLRRMQRIRNETAFHLTDPRFARHGLNEMLHSISNTPIACSEDGTFKNISFPMSLHAVMLYVFQDCADTTQMGTAMDEVAEVQLALFDCLHASFEHYLERLDALIEADVITSPAR